MPNVFGVVRLCSIDIGAMAAVRLPDTLNGWTERPWF